MTQDYDAASTVRSLAGMLGWSNVPPREVLERSLREERRRAKEDLATARAELQEAKDELRKRMEMYAADCDALATARAEAEHWKALAEKYHALRAVDAMRDKDERLKVAEAEAETLRKSEEDAQAAVTRAVDYARELLETAGVSECEGEPLADLDLEDADVKQALAEDLANVFVRWHQERAEAETLRKEREALHLVPCRCNCHDAEMRAANPGLVEHANCEACEDALEEEQDQYETQLIDVAAREENEACALVAAAVYDLECVGNTVTQAKVRKVIDGIRWRRARPGRGAQGFASPGDGPTPSSAPAGVARIVKCPACSEEFVAPGDEGKTLPAALSQPKEPTT